MNNSPVSVPVGRDLVPESWSLVPGFRTGEQLETVRSIIGSDRFAFSCNSAMFDPERGSRGPVAFTWFDRSGRVNVTRISARGRVLSSQAG